MHNMTKRVSYSSWFHAGHFTCMLEPQCLTTDITIGVIIIIISTIIVIIIGNIRIICIIIIGMIDLIIGIIVYA